MGRVLTFLAAMGISLALLGGAGVFAYDEFKVWEAKQRIERAFPLGTTNSYFQQHCQRIFVSCSCTYGGDACAGKLNLQNPIMRGPVRAAFFYDQGGMLQRVEYTSSESVQ